MKSYMNKTLKPSFAILQIQCIYDTLLVVGGVRTLVNNFRCRGFKEQK